MAPFASLAPTTIISATVSATKTIATSNANTSHDDFSGGSPTEAPSCNVEGPRSSQFSNIGCAGAPVLQQESPPVAPPPPAPVRVRRSERLQSKAAVSYEGMLGPAAKRARKICPRYEIDMLIDHRTEAGTDQFLVAWRHYADTTWEPTTMLKDDGVPDWYFQAVMDWKSEDSLLPFMRWAATNKKTAHLMQANNQNDCAQHAVDMALCLLGHGGAVTAAMKSADMASAKTKAGG
ncbi:hypothetical protein PR003_g4678 [Phytophthora rubi]|uniref:Chromo domain-containing protein n=1 Tax=Phytophthora rubi TaxID=129364 RepID=A0A6A4FUE3_9STRA|nr:hypothetical protein PR003_g4678 [Phytophthora rubi]